MPAVKHENFANKTIEGSRCITARKLWKTTSLDNVKCSLLGYKLLVKLFEWKQPHPLFETRLLLLLAPACETKLTLKAAIELSVSRLTRGRL